MANKSNGAINLSREAMNSYAQLAASTSREVADIAQRMRNDIDYWTKSGEISSADLEQVITSMETLALGLTDITTKMEVLSTDTLSVISKFTEVAINKSKKMSDAKDEMWSAIQAIKATGQN